MYVLQYPATTDDKYLAEDVNDNRCAFWWRNPSTAYSTTAVKILQIHTSSAARPQVISMTSGQTVKNVHTLLLLFDFQWHKLMV